MRNFTYTFLVLSFLFYSNINAQVKDIDGNTYTTLVINGKEWMTQNLNTSKFRNGEDIPQAKTKEEWMEACKAKQPVWAYPMYKEEYANYGRFYNWHAVNDPRGLAPEGWTVPSIEDWTHLAKDNEGAKLKSTQGWNSMDIQNTNHNPKDPYSKPSEFVNGNGTNSSGFNATPNSSLSFWSWSTKTKIDAIYWSSTETNEFNAKARKLWWINHDISTLNSSKSDGFMVRCVKK